MREEENGDNVVWPANEIQPTDENSVVIKKNQRCVCTWRKMHEVQCTHELRVHKVFKKEFFNPRWYTGASFGSLTVAFGPLFSVPLPATAGMELELRDGSDLDPQHRDHSQYDEFQDQDQGDDGRSDMEDEGSDMEDAAVDLDFDGADDKENQNQLLGAGRMTYGTLMGRLQELAKTVQNDQDEMAKIHSFVNEMIQRYRKNEAVDVCFDEFGSTSISRPSRLSEAHSKDVTALMPIKAQTRVVGNATNMARLRGYREINRGTKRKKGTLPSQFRESAIKDNEVLPAARTRERKCGLCKQGKHNGQFKCPSILKFGEPLSKNNRAIRNNLVQEILLPGTFVTYHREDPEMGIHQTLPTRNKKQDMQALIIHRRFFLDSNAVGSGFCVEITILHDLGREHPDYSRVLFDVSVVNAWIVKSKDNLVVSQLERAVPLAVAEASTLPPMQQQQQYLSQMIEYSQNVTSFDYGVVAEEGPLSQIGYGQMG
jgi:hypothetical protein